MMVVTVAFLVAGIVWPQAAEVWLRLVLVVLAVGFVAGRMHMTLLPVQIRPDLSSPFHGDVLPPTPPDAPQRLRDLTRELALTDDQRLSRRAEIPRSVRWTVIDEVCRRLTEHHGLNVMDANHHERIRSLVSTSTWSLIAPSDVPSPILPDPGAEGPVPLSELGVILDDLERL